MTAQDVKDAIWNLVGRHLPLDLFQDRLYVSAEAALWVTDPWPDIMEVAVDLHGLEMRLVRRPRLIYR